MHDGLSFHSLGASAAGIRHRTTRWPVVMLITLSAAMSACDRPGATAPTGGRSPSTAAPRTASSPGPDCAARCILLNTSAVFGAARAHPDSLDAPTELARVELRGNPGDSVAITLMADSAMLATLPDDESLTISDGQVSRTIALKRAVEESTVYRFSSDSVELSYSLNRRITALPSGSVSLTQITSAAVVSIDRPWVRQSAAGFARLSAAIAPNATSCSSAFDIPAPGDYCGLAVAFDPYVPAQAFLKFGAKFQNAEGTGISHPMAIEFSPAVSQVTVTAYDPTFDGNTMQAFDGTRSLGSASFPGNNRPGVFTMQTRTLSGHITRIVLTPAAAEYIAYSMTVSIAPPPTLSLECTPKTPTRVTLVHCVAIMSDSSAFVLKNLRASVGGTVVADTAVNATVTSFDWKGGAIAPTHVEAFASTAALGDLHAEAAFGIQARTTFVDADQSPNPAPIKASGPPFLKAAYPGMAPGSDSSWTIKQDGLGHTWHLFADYKVGRLRSGPNANLAFVTALSWVGSTANGSNGPIPEGIYLGAALFADDPFYQKQIGGGAFCGKSDMETLRGDIYRHEQHHRQQEIDLRRTIKLADQYEQLFVFAPAGTSQQALGTAFEAPNIEYGKRLDLNDSAIDADQPATTSITCKMRGL